MANSQLWYENRTRPPVKPETSVPWFLVQSKSKKHSSPSRDKRNEARLEKLTPRQIERIRIMSGSFHDQHVAEKVALDESILLDVQRGDVLVGQGGRYLHPRLFKVI